MKLFSVRVDLRVALLYATFGGLWILLSDRLLAGLVSDIASLSRLQTYKGWAFVAVSALLIFGLLRRELKLRKNAEGDFHESEERYRLLFENSLDAILLSTPDGRIFNANPSACRMFGRTEAELMQLGCKSLADWSDPSLAAAWEQRLRTGSFCGELTFIRKDGSTFPAEVSTAIYKNKAGAACASVMIRDITGRQQAEQALRESERRYRLISENSADVIWTLNPATGRFTYVSPSVLNLRGLTSEEVMAQPMQAALTPASYQFIAENLPARLAAFQSGDSSARTAITEVEQTRKDGSIVPTEVVTTLLTDAIGQVVEILGVTRDITERKQAEEQIQRQLKHLNSLHLVDIAISSSFDLQVVFDILLQQITTQLGVDTVAILLFNQELQVIEYAASRGAGAQALQHVRLRVGEGYAGRAMLERRTIRHHAVMQKGGGLAGALNLGNQSFVDYLGVPLIVKGEAKGVLEIYHRSPLQIDSESRQFLETLAGQAAIAIDNAQLFRSLQRANTSLERRVVERTADLHRANVELAHANRAKDEFLATMSHELRTPLNSILGLSESLLEQRHGPLNEHQQKYVQTIEASGRHLFELISDILDLSRIEAGKFDYHPQIMAVDELCRSSLAFVNEQAVRKSITVAYQNEASIAKISADPRRLKQVLINLLTNAIKFTHENGHVSLQVQTDTEKDRIQFSVSDDGIGIADEDLYKLFEPFVQLNGSLNRQYSGSGLGLALVQKLTDLHGGSVDVESVVGQGSRFTVNLPLRSETMEQITAPLRDEQAADTPLQTRPAPRGEFTLRGTVLIAEDNAANMLAIGDYLDRDGYKILTAHDGVEAIQKAEATHPDIILMDIQMPVMDGLEAMIHLRKNPRFASTPIIALTALAMPGDRERSLNAGATEYLSKPVSLKTLSETIDNLLGRV